MRAFARYARRRMRGPIAPAGFCLFTATAVARPVVFTAPRQGQVLQGGAVVEVSWTGVPASADEVELLLSLDGGRRVAVRLTEELSSGDRSYLWRVPNLSGRQAALVLRMGIEGREIESAPGALFEIRSEPERPAVPVAWRAGELWLSADAGARDADPLPAAGLDSPSGRWTPLRERSRSLRRRGVTLSGARPAGRARPIRTDSSGNAPRGFPAPVHPLASPGLILFSPRQRASRSFGSARPGSRSPRRREEKGSGR